MKKVISYSLWGDNIKYHIGAIENVKLAKLLYPEWTCRFYVDENLDSQTIKQLENLNAEIVYKKITHRYEPYMWRFLAAEDSDIMISRDCDSYITEREVVAVNEWLDSDKDFHIIRDSEYHNHKIMAGMWGVRNGLLKNITELVNKWNHLNMIHNDQMFLALIIYPKIIHTAFIHDEFQIFKNEKSTKIKYERPIDYYIGKDLNFK